jgi:hypothetical protein
MGSYLQEKVRSCSGKIILLTGALLRPVAQIAEISFFWERRREKNCS